MNILIIGAGAIGCLVGGKLAQSGESVILVGRPGLAQAVHAEGLRLEEEGEIRRIDDLGVSVSIAEAYQLAMDLGIAFDLAVVTVKSFDTAGVVDELRAALAESGVAAPVLFSLQNGVGNEESMAALVGADRVIAGSITAPVSVLTPGHIRVARPGYGISLATWDQDTPAVNLKEVAAAIERSGFRLAMHDSAQSLKWSKLIMNMVGNALCAILDETPQQVYADARMLNVEIAAWREMLAVMAKSGIRPITVGKFPWGILGPIIRWGPKWLIRVALRRIVSGARGGKMPSLHMDLSRNRDRNEVAWLNGAVVRQGRVVDIPTPVNALLNDTLLTLVSNHGLWDEWRHDHDRVWGMVGALIG